MPAEIFPYPSDQLSDDFDKSLLQDNWTYRNAFLAREIATQLIDKKGNFDFRHAEHLINYFKEHQFSLKFSDNAHCTTHILNMLEAFLKNKEFSNLLKKIFRPFGQRAAESLIRSTLFLSEHDFLTDADARKAALAALFTSLRQNVGSCFATAPAILIQQEQPEKFLKDIAELFATGRLTKIIDGVEYAVPFNTNSGLGDLKRQFYPYQLGDDPCALLGKSPGLIAAFESTGLIDSTIDWQQKKMACTNLLHSLEEKLKDTQIVTAEFIIRHMYLQIHQVDEESLKEYEQQPQQMVMTSMVIQQTAFLSHKFQLCQQFLQDFEKAKQAFKQLTENVVLKAWEFTLASFSETKNDFCRWNLYVSLGFESQEEFGIGNCIYITLQEKLAQVNKEAEIIQSRYDHIYAQIKSLEGRVRNVKTESDANWIQAEYQMRKFEMNHILSEHEKLDDKAKQLSGLYNYLLNFYDSRFKDYFQEIYDPEMIDITTSPYDDSPAGFRLLYKHGRSNTSLWTKIQSANEFTQALVAFFIATETELLHHPEMTGLQKELTEIISSIAILVKTPRFLNAALQRMAKAHKEKIFENPLENLDAITKKPWAYISGGTMVTLISTYYHLPDRPKFKERWVENEWELLAFYIDCLKEMPYSTQKNIHLQSQKSLLAYSPTHAYLIKPNFHPFKEAWWDNNAYTYTWIRDQWINPGKRWLEGLILSHQMMYAIIEEISRKLPIAYQERFRSISHDLPFTATSMDFQSYILYALSYETWARQGGHIAVIAEEIESTLFSMLPLTPGNELVANLNRIFSAMNLPKMALDPLEIDETISMGRFQLLSAKKLFEIAKNQVIKIYGKAEFPENMPQHILNAMRKESLAMPQPVLFADSNWVKNYFGFCVNPGNGKFELWRFDELGLTGRPIWQWKSYLDGSQKQPWGLFTSPQQYSK